MLRAMTAARFVISSSGRDDRPPGVGFTPTPQVASSSRIYHTRSCGHRSYVKDLGMTATTQGADEM